MFHLPATDQNIRFLFEYPLSQSYDILKINDESTCPRCASEMLKQFDLAIRHNTGNAKRLGEKWTLSEQTAYVHGTLFDLLDAKRGGQDNSK